MATNGKGISGYALCTFRERPYEVSFEVKSDKLVVQVQDETTTDQWRGAFDARHLEELTRKTGNFKQFRVFVNMLDSALQKTSDCVSLELLTYSDLESLRQHRTCHSSSPPPPRKTSSTIDTSRTPTKRYLILTYCAEFDRIHYPLALPYLGKTDPILLQEMIRKLKKELEHYKKQTSKQHKSVSTKLLKKYETLLQEKEELEQAYETLQEEVEEHIREGGGGGERDGRDTKTLRKIIKNMEEDMLKEKTRYQRLLAKKNDEMKSLMDELEELRASKRLLNSKVKNLTNEIALLKRSPLISTRHHTRSGSGSTNTNTAIRGTGQHKNTPPSTSWTYSNTNRQYRSSSAEGRLMSNGGRRGSGLRSRTPSPKGKGFQRFDPTSYVLNKRKQQEETDRRLGRNRSRSNSLERPRALHSPSPITSSRRINIIGQKSRSRTSSVGSSRGGSSCPSSDSGDDAHSLYEPKRGTAPKGGGTIKRSSSNHNFRKGLPHGKFNKVSASTPVSRNSRRDVHNDSSILEHSMEIQEIDARLNALQQFMKKSLDSVRNSRSNT